MPRQPPTPQPALILIVHLDLYIRKILIEVFELEGYSAHGAGSGEEALRLLQAAEGGMIVYLEPLLLGRPGNEHLHEYVMSGDGHMLHVWVLLANMYHIEQATAPLRADSYLAQPFTVDQAFTSLEDAQRLLQAKRITAADPLN
jgi:DNA-binding NtrC family response regulator